MSVRKRRGLLKEVKGSITEKGKSGGRDRFNWGKSRVLLRPGQI